MSAQALDVAAQALCAAEEGCTNTLARWFPSKPHRFLPQLIVSTTRCAKTPVTGWVSEYCTSCGHAVAGNWCASCIECYRFELAQVPTVLRQCCADSQVKMTFGPAR